MRTIEQTRSTANPTGGAADRENEPSFRLFEAGPILHWLQQIGTLPPTAEQAAARAMVAVLVAWVPLPLLALWSGRAFGATDLPLVQDIQVHVRALITLPLYILAAQEAQNVLSKSVQQFVTRGIVRPQDRPQFARILRDSASWNRSVLLRVSVGAAIVLVLPGLWKHALLQRYTTAWYGDQTAAGISWTPAGYWLLFVTNPIVQYLHLLWAVRMVLFCISLGRVARLDLHLVPTHPDQAGGLGFVGAWFYAFGKLIVAEGASVAGLLANRIFVDGQSLPHFQLDIAAAACGVAAVILGPMCVFMPHLLRARRRGLAMYGQFANQYVREFEDTWIRGTADRDRGPLLGTADIQSLADLANSYAVVREMRPVPFGARVVFQVFVLFLAPISPLLLTVVPAEELLNKAISVLI
jgi:hypothetical protein